MLHRIQWNRGSTWTAGALLAAAALIQAPEPAAPQVFSVIEGTETSTGNVALSYKSKSMIVLSCPATIVAGDYLLPLDTGKSKWPAQSHRVRITAGGVMPGTVIEQTINDTLRTDLDDAATLAGQPPMHYLDAGNIDAGTLDTSRFSAHSDLIDELGVGTGAGQLVTSSRPGHAMRAPGNPRAGTIVGKALGELPSATGVIEILLSLQ